MHKRFTYKGKYKPQNPEKYKGNSNNIIYRSMWERRFMKYCDTNPSVIAWASEELIIPYLSPIDKKIHRYYPDFVVRLLDKDNKIKTMVIEVKPKKETKPPRKKQKKTFKYLEEVRVWGVNDAKWKAAKDFCLEKGWEFKILTEDHLVK
jgi:hypothetical protein